MNISSKNIFFSAERKTSTRNYTLAVSKLPRITSSSDLLLKEIQKLYFLENTELAIMTTELWQMANLSEKCNIW